ncbi:MAG TPA: E3 binding domain-containing protein [Conexibacter sp.]|nr:E3 binding domain-containing protein [Conexibacter sp.]
MAAQRTSSKDASGGGRRGLTAEDVKAPQRGEHRGRRASEKTDRYRFAQNVAGAGTAAEREYEAYALAGIDDPRGDPDVLLDVPVVKVDSIHLELDDLDAHVSLLAKVLDLVKLSVGVDVHLGQLRVDVKGVEAQALLKVRLERVTAIVDRVLTTLDRNPELLESLGRTLEDVGQGAGHTLGKTGEAVEDVGSGAKSAVRDVGSGAGQAVGDVGAGAGQAVGDVGEGAGQAVGQVGGAAGEAVGDVGAGAGQAVGDVGEGAGQAVGNLDQTVQGAGQTAGQAVGGLSEGAGAALGELEQAVTGALHGNGGGADPSALAAAASPKNVAKLAARYIVHELKQAAVEETKGLGLAATRKAIEIGERRKQQQAEQHHATTAALRKAQELDVDLDEIDGTGADGRITIRDVHHAHVGS